jgi:DNA-binding response OmpR family regulator
MSGKQLRLRLTREKRKDGIGHFRPDRGRQFLARLRADAAWAAVPVIVATGLGAEALGALGDMTTDILAKPFTEEVLLATVRRLLGER